jgi:serine/threonine-protein kinase
MRSLWQEREGRGMTDEQTRRCPYCDEEIRSAAVRCKHCGMMLDGTGMHVDTRPSQAGTRARSGATPPPGTAPARGLGTTAGKWAGTLPIEPGTQIREYRFEKTLGKGGMGEVYRATHVFTEQAVAIKVLYQNLMRDEQGAKRFVEEARTMAALRHPNIIQFMNFFEEAGTYFLVMEFVDGVTLSNIVRRNPVRLSEAIHISKGVLAGLDYAHNHPPHIVHRDIKPSNIMISNDDQVYIADFGIAKAVGRERLVETRGIVGTVEYMAPEQVKGETVSAATDIYSYGVTLYKMLSGVVPFPQKTDTGIDCMNAHLRTPVPPIREINADIPEWLEVVLKKALEKNPADRFATAGEMLKAIEEGESKLGRNLLGHRIPTELAMTATILDPAQMPKTGAGEAVAGAQGTTGEPGTGRSTSQVKRETTRPLERTGEASSPPPPSPPPPEGEDSGRSTGTGRGSTRGTARPAAPAEPGEELEARLPRPFFARPLFWVIVLSVPILIAAVLFVVSSASKKEKKETAATQTGETEEKAPPGEQAPAPQAGAGTGTQPSKTPVPTPQADTLRLADARSEQAGTDTGTQPPKTPEPAPQAGALRLADARSGQAGTGTGTGTGTGGGEPPPVEPVVKEPPEGMAAVAAGTYEVGCPAGSSNCFDDEKPPKTVVAKRFAISKHETTVAQYEECVQAAVCPGPGEEGKCNWGRKGKEDHPVNCVDWSGATAFCNFKGWRLPTEEEWEVAARGQDSFDYVWGNDRPTCVHTIMKDGRKGGCGNDGTAPVGNRGPDRSWCGAFDLGGNVREWVSTSYAAYPGGTIEEGARGLVNRGGSWEMDKAAYGTVHTRQVDEVGERRPDLGFRCALTLE